MRHKRLVKKILLFALCIAMIFGKITFAHAKQVQESTQNSNAVPADGTTVTINGEEVPLNEGENITKNDYTGFLCVGIFAGVLLIAGARELVVRKRLK